MNRKKHKSPSKGRQKTFASGRTPNPTNGGRAPGEQNLKALSGFQQHDALNRMGSFEGRGEHARTGSRGHQ
jgi:hypothetical protein